MASIINQSRYVVRVKRRPDPKREFPHTKKNEELDYHSRLINLDNLPAEIEQLANQLLVRARRRGHPEQTIRATSFVEAEKIELNLAAQQSCGLFIDYTRARSVTGADLITRYINEECLTKECQKKEEGHKHRTECFKHKSGMVELYTLQSFLADSRHELANAIRESIRAEDHGEEFPVITARREPRTSLALEKLLAPAREKAKRARNATARQRYLRRARKVALRQLNRHYEIIPLYEAIIAFLLETAARRGEAQPDTIQRPTTTLISRTGLVNMVTLLW